MKNKKHNKPKSDIAIFVIPEAIRKLLRKEAYESRRSQSAIVREAIIHYFLRE